MSQFRGAGIPLAGQTDVQEWSSSSVAGGLVTEQWCRMVADPEAREDQGQLTRPVAMKCHLYWVTTSLLAARVFPVEK